MVSNKDNYTEKIKIMLSDTLCYQTVKDDPTDMLRKKIFQLMNRWLNSSYLAPDIEIKDINTEDTNLPRCCSTVKVNKPNFPLRIIVSYIDSPLSIISDIYKNIISSACPLPSNVLKNSLELKNRINNITIPKNHIMASFHVVSMFKSIPIYLAKTSIKNRWSQIKSLQIYLQQSSLKVWMYLKLYWMVT